MVKQISLSLRMRSFHNGTNYLADRLFGYQGNLIQAKTIYLAGSMVEYQTGDWIGFPNGEENPAMLPRPRNYRLIKFENDPLSSSNAKIESLNWKEEGSWEVSNSFTFTVLFFLSFKFLLKILLFENFKTAPRTFKAYSRETAFSFRPCAEGKS